MRELPRTQKWLIPASIAALVGVLAFIFGLSYFTQTTLYIHDERFTVESEQPGERTIYRGSSGLPIEVRYMGNNRHVIIQSDLYTIERKADSPYALEYEVVYPGGDRYRVTDQHNMLMAFDEAGEIVFSFGLYVNGTRVVQEGERTYSPTALVTAAYERYHQPQGSAALYVLALLLFAFGWCSFRYKQLQDVLFWLSLKPLWVHDPEPSDFYYVMTKAGGCIIMGMAVVMLLFSVFV